MKKIKMVLILLILLALSGCAHKCNAKNCNNKGTVEMMVWGEKKYYCQEHINGLNSALDGARRAVFGY